MTNLSVYHVDAFAEKPCTGNPAAVVPLESWIDDSWLQRISNENNLAETAFIVPRGNDYEIRWFTPTLEVALCGHATLASAYVVFNYLKPGTGEVVFHSRQSGDLIVTSHDEYIELDFPTDTITPDESMVQADLLLGVGKQPLLVFRGKTDFMLIFDKQEDVEDIIPDFSRLAKVKARGIIVTAPGKEVDFVSRFFAPQSGISEDPVTGSAHTTLIPYWYAHTGKTEMTALQLSDRKGTLHCQYAGSRVKIAGKAWLYMKGEINSEIFG